MHGLVGGTLMRLAVILAGLALSTPAAAQIEITYVDAAPTDIFEITNLSACPSGTMDLTIDLEGSQGGLLFDTTPRGLGVQVSQPLVITEGTAFLAALPQVSDGARQITLSIADLPGQSMIGFTIDVDDTLPQSQNGQTRVSGSEMAGAQVRLSGAAVAQTAAFEPDGRAVLMLNTCLS